MFLKRTRTGGHTYLQLVRAYRDADGKARQRTLTVGRVDELDAEALRRLARALLEEADRLEGVARPEGPSEPVAKEGARSFSDR